MRFCVVSGTSQCRGAQHERSAATRGRRGNARTARQRADGAPTRGRRAAASEASGKRARGVRQSARSSQQRVPCWCRATKRASCSSVRLARGNVWASHDNEQHQAGLQLAAHDIERATRTHYIELKACALPPPLQPNWIYINNQTCKATKFRIYSPFLKLYIKNFALKFFSLLRNIAISFS